MLSLHKHTKVTFLQRNKVLMEILNWCRSFFTSSSWNHPATGWLGGRLAREDSTDGSPWTPTEGQRRKLGRVQTRTGRLVAGQTKKEFSLTYRHQGWKRWLTCLISVYLYKHMRYIYKRNLDKFRTIISSNSYTQLYDNYTYHKLLNYYITKIIKR